MTLGGKPRDTSPVAMKRSRKGASFAVVAPCFDEEEALRPFMDELVPALEEAGLDYVIYLVDDGSTDGTAEIMAELARLNPRVRPKYLSRNFGHQIALTAGLDAAAGADAVLVMAADLQDPPSTIEELVAEWEDGGDVILAVRCEAEGLSWFKRTTSRLFYRFFNLLADTQITPGAADFYLLSSQAHRAILRFPERRRLLRALVHWIGFERRHVNYDAPPRVSGKTKYTLVRMVRLAVDGIATFSTQPIRLATRVGLLTVLSGLGTLTYLAMQSWLGDTAPADWGWLLGALLILGGLQLTFIGLVGSYVARIFEESKSRPLYLLKEDPDEEALHGATKLSTARAWSQRPRSRVAGPRS